MKLASRLRTLERRAGAEAHERALCGLCGGLGRYNARTFTNGVPERDEPPEACPACGKVRLVHLHLTICERISGPPVVVVGEAA